MFGSDPDLPMLFDGIRIAVPGKMVSRNRFPGPQLPVE